MWMMNRRVKPIIASVALLSMLAFMFPVMALADAVEGETVVTLGENLSAEQRQQLLDEMGESEESTIITVSNEEEHHYLGDYVDAATIGTRALSSSKIVLAEEGYGVHVETNRITWVTEEMYANALVTAGVEDADVYVTAPMNVSGTAGLTGLIKAFEEATDVQISEEQKDVANEEMVTTADLADRIGSAEAAELMSRLKEALADRDLETDEDYRQLVLDIAVELNINLNDDDVDALVHLLKRLQGLNIDWDRVSGQLEHIRDNLDDILNSEDTRNFLRQALDFVVDLIDQIRNWFSS